MGGMVILVVAAIVASMAIAIYMYTEYRTNYVEVAAGQPVMVGPVEYTIVFENTHGGDKEEKPNDIFVMIAITAENKGDQSTILSGGQFYIIDANNTKKQPTYGKFSAKDLLVEELKPGQIVERTTQFDIPFDEDSQYKILVRPQKEQSTMDVASVCITNC